MEHRGRRMWRACFAVALGVVAMSCTSGSSSPRAATVAEEPTTTVGALPFTGPDDGALAQCEDAAANAHITYQPTSQMTVGEVTDIVVAANTGAASPDAAATPFAAGVATTVVPAELACHVQARLSGEEFTVDPQGYQDRSFLGTDHVDWSWQVEPQRTGDDLRLTLELQGVVHTATEGDLPTGTRTFHADIHVKSSPEGFWTRVNDVVVGFVEHPVIQFIGAAGLAGLAVWLFRTARQRVSQREVTEEKAE